MTKSFQFDEVLEFVRLRVKQFPGLPSFEEVDNRISEILEMMGGQLSAQEREQIRKSVFAEQNVTMGQGFCLEDAQQNFKPWYEARRASIQPDFWGRFKNYLAIDKGIGREVLNVLDQTSTRLVGLLGDPQSDSPFSRKGLIMGDVQSGKTMNFTAIINKAVDAGYRVIFVLTGSIESLRRQTQERLDEEFSGRLSANWLANAKDFGSYGVAKYSTQTGRNLLAYPLTSATNDFSVAALMHVADVLAFLKSTDKTSDNKVSTIPPVYCVVKKNARNLKNIINWLGHSITQDAEGRIPFPALIIDDEADYASINVNSDEDSPTRINALIRRLINCFTRVNYLAVTATPFANIFINPDTVTEMYNDDLFPRDFIYDLTTPSNYMGIEEMFGGEEPAGIVSVMEDLKAILPNHHKKNAKISRLPESLREAVRYFCLANGVMDLLGEQMPKHRSMLVHVSHYTKVHRQVERLTGRYLTDLRNAIGNYAGLPPLEAEANEDIHALHETWNAFPSLRREGRTWEHVLGALHEAVSPIMTKVVNSDRNGGAKWSYDDYADNGLRVIVVGGNSLARGLTLEGLTVSYFRRSTQMYDTLLQMSRWFGYRGNYKDLCRVWMTPEIVEEFQSIALAYEEFKEDVIRMQEGDYSPRDFGLRIRRSGAALLPTARNKMRNAHIFAYEIDIVGRLLESANLQLSKLKGNERLAREFLEKALPRGIRDETYGHALWRNVPKEDVANFLERFATYKWSFEFRGQDLATHIREKMGDENWDVAIAQGSALVELPPLNIGGSVVRIMPERRKFLFTPEDENDGRIRFHRSRVSSGGAIAIGLSKECVKEMEALYRKEHASEGKKNVRDDYFLRPETHRAPILLVHFVTPSTAVPQLIGKIIVAVTVGIPGAKYRSEPVVYYINHDEWRRYTEFEEDEDETIQEGVEQ